ncbi:ankyrin repeat domain-containing protein [Desulfopila sp. IMCC35008]|uniref:ankyrin repeat domain-containing protein n=1 Tax=Desulfopila sp. IMCC35008 TaxID=2653858 RepID=UPI0013D8A7E7|nr:ankyrin repeat domain-containing protein [Desulfopila sp. IMCC35008]
MFGLSKEEKFWSACKKSDYWSIVSLLKNSPYLTVRTDRHGKHGLTYAVDAGDYQCVEAILESGRRIPINEYDKTASNPLSIAIKKRNLLIAKLLIEHGADVSQNDYLNITPVWDSSHRGAMERSGVGGFCDLAMNCFIEQNNPLTNQWGKINTPKVDTYNTNGTIERQFGMEMGKYCTWLSSYSGIFDDLNLRRLPNTDIVLRMLILAISEQCIQKVFHISDERVARISEPQAKEVFDNFIMANRMSLSIGDLNLPSNYYGALTNFYNYNIEDDLTYEFLFDLYELVNEVFRNSSKEIRQRWYLIQQGHAIDFMPITEAATNLLCQCYDYDENILKGGLSNKIPRLFGELQCKCKAHHSLF